MSVNYQAISDTVRYLMYVRHLAVRSGEHIVISPLINKNVQPRKESAVCHHFLNYNYSPSFEDFSVLYYESKKYLFELKESFLIMRDRPSVDRNIRSTPLYLFELVITTLFVALC